MKFGHLLKEFGQEAEVPADALLNYKKLKKLIKAQRQSKEVPEPSAAPAATAASAEPGGGTSEDEEFPSSAATAGGAAPTGEAAAAARAATAPAAAAAAAGGAAGGATDGGTAAGGAAAGGAAAPADAEAAAPAAAQPAGRAADAGGAPDQADADGAVGVAEEDREFIQTLHEDLSRINAYFMEREEEAVIRLHALQDTREGAGADGRAASAEQLEQLRSEMVDFHGELVLLLHWSLVNYAAVAKILKKHDKLTGSRLRAPVLASVLHQPFLSTESISQLVKAAEQHVQELTSLCGGGGHGGGDENGEGRTDARAAEGSAEVGPADPEAAALAAGGTHVAIYKRTRAALHMLNDMQETASTPSTLLPPSTANSDAAPDGKKARSMLGGELRRHHQQQQPQPSASQQQPQSPVVEVEAH